MNKKVAKELLKIAKTLMAGWSCSAMASTTLENLEKRCRKQTGSQNTFKDGEDEYFFEHDEKEYDDGSVTGDVEKFVGENRAINIGRFKIDGKTGRVVIGPPVFKRLANSPIY